VVSVHTVADLECEENRETWYPMPYAVVFTPEADRDLRALRAVDRVRIAEQCRRLLGTNPTLTSQARIKRLRPGTYPPYRLRVGDFRIFYDVDEGRQRVVVYGVVVKSQAESWRGDFQREQDREADNDC
jgi:mRNA-degrading endonuclease RelE of RelBE toxin-antitoxin system